MHLAHSFNPLPPLLVGVTTGGTGDTGGTGGFNPLPPLLVGVTGYLEVDRQLFLFQSAPTVVGGSNASRFTTVKPPAGFNPLPPLLVGVTTYLLEGGERVVFQSAPTVVGGSNLYFRTGKR